MTNLSDEAKNVLTALRDAQESTYTRKDAEGHSAEWGSVYLDNAAAALHRGGHPMTRHAFAGYLSALHEAGVYDSQDDGFFGWVKLTD